MKRVISLVIAVVMLSGILVGCSGGSNTGNTAGNKPVEIKIAAVGNDDHQSTIMAKYFKEELEKLYDGELKIDIYPNGSLGGEREAAEGVKLGTIQMTVVTSDGTLPAWVPDIQVLSIPYLFENKEQAYKVLDGVISEQLVPKFEEQGFKHLGFGELGFRHFTNNIREIKSAADMKGLSIRVQEAPIWFALMKSLQASAVPVSFNELYTALQQGMVDGQENPIASIATSKFNEVQKYLTLDGHTYAAVSMIMNKGFYDGLPEDLRAAIDQAAKNAVPRQREAVSAKEAEYLQQLKDSGMVVTEPDKESFVEATKDLYKLEEVKALVNPELVELVINNR
ncbi:DctP family TRAP transporter solute-binding subunit [Lutispora sp.]|uniref:TRAP transporter substrate-binding protein n=1 Tax=Lutispora sp. TaxID=2828727 RepID=UPI003562DE77